MVYLWPDVQSSSRISFVALEKGKRKGNRATELNPPEIIAT
jgi:hypothetical protein